MKQFLILSTFLLGWRSFSIAQDTKLIAGPQVNADTTVEKVSPLPEQSAGIETPVVIKDLFVSDAANSNMAPKLNPRAVSFVSDYMEKYSKSLQEMKSWALPYFNMIDAIMVQNGLPRELKYLAVIESELKSGATSWAGAVGPWQLMPGTARTLGLKVNRKVDERRNYVKSTQAAARYLKDLYAIYNDWLLVIASYNAGPGSVQKAIARSGSRNFWDLQYYLPAETRSHVKKFIGTHYVFEGQGGLTTLTKAETKAHYGPNLYAFTRNITREEQESAISQQVSGKYQSVVIAKYTTMDIADFNRFNPDFDKVMAGISNSYDMKLPADKMDLFKANKYNILQESVQLLLNSTAVNNNNIAAGGSLEVKSLK
ncbi:lytic transglycosylase domain-containing protein [Flavihumibacter profundi]|uniref:lytic transglycosylase domain-containing protein n=1 Tax=Flavihumibacter profundi TaxID=2716883 RepID=UPI001CC3459D|nr:lytic transglycosylase domain-containing protein [Flavihumibacter profundi]MBZ5858178.1 transglycosylase SLT domain-containing protein [Flavihumibacter profundi]